MSIFQSIILGIVQGLTEFLPVSSTGHLIIVPEILGWAKQPLVFDTTLHLATAAALIIYFWKDYLNIFLSLVKNPHSKESLLGIAVIIGVIPAGLLGFFLEDVFENAFRGVGYVALFLTFGSLLMFLAEKSIRKEFEITPKKGLIIGMFQAIALLPGVSRSGSTISGGMLTGLSREQATRFSFLLSVPIVVLAGLFKLVSSYKELLTASPVVIGVGFIAGLLSGLVAIKFLLKFVKTHTLYPFIIYRLVLALGLLILILK